MINSSADPFPSNAGETLIAEVKALSNRVQLQHRLIEILMGRARIGTPQGTPPSTVVDLLPVHPLRATTGRVPAEDQDDEAIERFLSNDAVPPPNDFWWPVEVPDTSPLHPSPGWACCSEPPTAIVVGFILRKANVPTMDQAVDFVSSVQRERGMFVPVFVTDTSDFSPFRRHGYTVEYLPELMAEEAEGRRLRRRRDFIERKWNISRFIELGAGASFDWEKLRSGAGSASVQPSLASRIADGTASSPTSTASPSNDIGLHKKRQSKPRAGRSKLNAT